MKQWTTTWQELILTELAGPTRLVINGTSMMPTVHPGDEVLVEPVTAEELRIGDWVVIRSGGDALMHRYLGHRGDGLLTKGDNSLVLDPVWPTPALVGRVTEAWRNGGRYYRRQGAGSMPAAQNLLARGHLIMAITWRLISKVKSWLVALLLLSLTASGVLAAVTIASFEVEAAENEVLVYWETASEVGNLGFYVWRSDAEDGPYEKLPLDAPGEQFIPSDDLGFGSVYDYVDADVTPGETYWYRVQDVPSDGGEGDYTDPLSATVPTETSSTPQPTPQPTSRPTRTPTPTRTAEVETATPTATRTPTSTPQPSATETPSSTVRFWASETALAAGDCTTLQWQATDVQALYFDGLGVTGVGARTFCPCEDQTFTLTAVYQDGRREDLTVEIGVTGTCDDDAPAATATSQPSSIATPTDAGETDTAPEAVTAAEATSTPAPTARPRARTRTPSPTVSPTPEAATPPSTVSVSPLVTPTPPVPDFFESGDRAAEEGAESEPEATTEALVIQGETRRPSALTAASRWLVLAAFVGLGLVAGGLWFFWSRR